MKTVVFLFVLISIAGVLPLHAQGRTNALIPEKIRINELKLVRISGPDLSGYLPETTDSGAVVSVDAVPYGARGTLNKRYST